ncbi:MAG: hypothetical protein AB2591_03955 [Candidatus Thiodiazotropha sp.]
MKTLTYSLLFLTFVTPTLALAEQCTWVEDKEIIDHYLPVSELESGLQDWDVNCKAEDPSHEIMKKCWCDINRTHLVELKKRIDEIEVKFPQLAGKKVCFKENEFTSRNVRFSSSKAFFKRCNI